MNDSLPRKNACQLILALDVDSREEALELLRRTGDAVSWAKVGLQLFSRLGPDIVREIADLGKRIFLDLKLHDIPETAAKAVDSVCAMPADLLTIHACGGREMLRAAAEAKAAARPSLGLLGVTLLTSADEATLRDLGIPEGPARRVDRLAELARASGLDGLVCSPREAAALRRRFGPNLVLVCPGVRPSGTSAGDQKRVATPAEAAAAGADYIVVGRPISRASDPASAAAAIQAELAGALSES